MTTYRYSALAAAALRMWRAWAVIVPVVVVNALVQALLVVPTVDVDDRLLRWALGAVGLAVAATGYGLVVAAALRVPDGRVGWPAVLGQLRRHGARYAGWALGWVLVVTLGFALWTVPGLLVMAATPYVLLAATDGQRNPVVQNFRVLWRRSARWLITVVLVGLLVLVGWAVAGLTMFFLRGALGSFVVWTVAGVVASWVTVAWGLIYRGGVAEDR